MSDILCGYSGDREAALMAYLYGEMTPADRVDFDGHLAACARCRVELTGLGEVRRRLSLWSPPAFNPIAGALASRAGGGSLVAIPSSASRPPAIDVPASVESTRRSWWREMPAWAQVAAAMLVLGVSAGVANLDVHYDAQSGLNIHTGWSRRAPAAAATRAAATDPAPWRAELTALERQLRSELHAAAPAATAVAARGATVNDADVVRRLKTLIDESERRQQNELALRIAEIVRDVNSRRDADLRKIDMSLGAMFDRTGVEVMKNRQMIDYYMQRVSQRQ